MRIYFKIERPELTLSKNIKKRFAFLTPFNAMNDSLFISLGDSFLKLKYELRTIDVQTFRNKRFRLYSGGGNISIFQTLRCGFQNFAYTRTGHDSRRKGSPQLAAFLRASV